MPSMNASIMQLPELIPLVRVSNFNANIVVPGGTSDLGLHCLSLHLVRHQVLHDCVNAIVNSYALSSC